MEIPFTNAAKRGADFSPVPIRVAFASQIPKDCTYWRLIGPDCATEPASARPNPSRMDFLPMAKTSAGISSKRVLRTKSTTYWVRPLVSGKAVVACWLLLDAKAFALVAAMAAPTAKVLLRMERRDILSCRFIVVCSSLSRKSQEIFGALKVFSSRRTETAAEL